MNIQVIPEEITKSSEAESLHIHEYGISKSVDKNKIHLTKHVCSFLLEGSKRLITPHEEITIENDQFLMIKSGNCLMSEKISLSKHYRSLLLFFDQNTVQQFVQKHGFEIDNKSYVKPFFIGNYDLFMRHLIQGLLAIKQMPLEFQQRLLPLRFEEILLYLVQKHGTSFLTQFVEQNHSDFSFVQTIQKNVLTHLTVEELAFLCNMSVSTFKRHFEREFQTSPMRWFLEKRLEHAYYLLNQMQKRPSDIYHEAGFESLSSFTQAFKQKFGITPKQLQKSTWTFSNIF